MHLVRRAAPNLLVSFLLMLGTACGDGSAPADGGTNADTDAARGTDADTDADAALLGDGGTELTECGDQFCDRASEICVVCACGGPDSYSCEPVPADCEADRTCGCVGDGVCPQDQGQVTSCTDREDNVVFCDLGRD